MKKYFDQSRISIIKDLALKKQNEQALTLIDEYRSIYPNDKLIEVYYAKILANQKDLDAAEEILRDVLSDKLHNKDARQIATTYLAEVLGHNDKLSDSLKYYKEALELCPDKTYKTLESMAYTFLKHRMYDEALKAINTKSPDARIDSKLLVEAKIYYKKRESFKALELLKRIDDNNISTIQYQTKYLQMALIHLYYSDLEDAITCAQKVLKIKNKFYYRAKAVIAQIHFANTEYKEAEEICNSILEKYDLIEAYDVLTNVYFETGNIQKINETKDKIKMEARKRCIEARLDLLKGNYLDAKNKLELSLKEDNGDNVIEVMFNLLVANFRLKDYESCKSIIFELENNYKNSIPKNHKKDIDRIKLTIRIKENKVDPNKVTGYGDRQIYKYSKEEAINHIITNHKIYDEASFSENIDVRRLFDEVKEKLNEENKVHVTFTDIYIIEYPKVGIRDKDYLNRLQIVCLPDTKNILTMFPVDTGEIHDEKEEIEPINKGNTRKLSQIEKFNQRYKNYM